MKPLTLTELYALPAAVDLMTAARALNMGRTLAYELARNGNFPCTVLRYGEVYRLLNVPIPNADTDMETKR